MRKAYKSLISLAVVLIAGLYYIEPAFAQDPFTAVAVGGLTGASGAGLFGSMAGMSGIDIAWGNNTADQMDAMWNVLNPDHVYFSGEKHEANPQEYPEDVYDYINVDIGDWLSAQSDFIVNFAQTHNVQDNDSGSVNVTKSYAGYAFFNHSGNNDYGSVVGQTGDSLTLGEYSWIYVVGSSSDSVQLYKNGTLLGAENVSKNLNGQLYFGINGYNQIRAYYKVSYSSSYWAYGPLGDAIQVTPSSNINWSTGSVNTSVFDGWNSAKVKIPHNISQLSSGWTLSDFLIELDRIWYGGGEDNIIIENGGDVPPVPPVPVPDTPLGDVPFDDWVDLWGQGIYQQLDNQSDALDLIGSNGEDAIEDLESIDSNLDDLNQTAESIDTNIGIGNGILGGIRSLAQSAVDYLEDIAEHVGELVEEIVEGTETLISGILNQIPQAFGIIFGPIKQASSIWHYVVEWIQSIGAPLQFIWTMASGTSYYIILPVYASLAAAVVLAFYKRFGK